MIDYRIQSKFTKHMLDLPVRSQIHLIFYIKHEAIQTINPCQQPPKFQLFLRATIYTSSFMEVLVQWDKLPRYENSWETFEDIQTIFEFQTGDIRFYSREE